MGLSFQLNFPDVGIINNLVFTVAQNKLLISWVDVVFICKVTGIIKLVK